MTWALEKQSKSSRRFYPSKSLPLQTNPIHSLAAVSLLGNWQAEAKKFSPSLKIAIAHSSEKNGDIATADLVLTTYTFIHRWAHLRENGMGPRHSR